MKIISSIKVGIGIGLGVAIGMGIFELCYLLAKILMVMAEV